MIHLPTGNPIGMLTEHRVSIIQHGRHTTNHLERLIPTLPQDAQAAAECTIEAILEMEIDPMFPPAALIDCKRALIHLSELARSTSRRETPSSPVLEGVELAIQNLGMLEDLRLAQSDLCIALEQAIALSERIVFANAVADQLMEFGAALPDLH